MTPNRELDRQIAEWMGYEGIRPDTVCDRETFTYPSKIMRLADGSVVMCEVPHFSEDIAAAFLVVEHVRGLGYWFSVSQNDESAMATFWRPEASLENDCDGRAKLPAEAICRAALAVAEAEKKQES